MIDLLRRAWSALDTFKQAYPENWHDEDEQVLNDLLKADLKLQDHMPLFDDWEGGIPYVDPKRG